MAAVPDKLTHTPPQEPTTKQLEEGWPFAVSFASNPGLTLWPDTVKVPGVKTDGNAIVTSTQFNKEVVTKAPPGLKEITDGEIDCALNSISVGEVYDQCGKRDSVSFTWPDGFAYVCWGYMESGEIEAFAMKKFPKIKCKIVITNRNPHTGKEEKPIMIKPKAPAAAK